MEFALDATLLGCGVGTATVTLVTYSSRTRLDSITITVEEVEDRLSLPFISNKSGTVGTSLTVQLPEASGGDPPYRYALSGLPTTLTFTESTRRITGTPTSVAVYDLEYTATDDDGNGDSVSETFKLVVANPPLALPTIDDASGTVGTSLTVQLPEASGGAPPYRYALSGLPTTLTFTESTRRITGTPTSVAVYDLEYTATDDNGNGDSVSETFKLVVANPPLALPTIDDASGTVGTSLTVQLPEASGGDPPYRYALSGLPSELSNDLGYTWCWEDARTRGCAPPRSDEETTDVFIRRSPFDNPGGNMPDRLHLRGSEVVFNRCPDPDGVYGTLVHEAGHALGLGHSTLGRDSVMHEELSNLNYMVRCAPHPFDIMMFFALYQTR